MLLRGFIIFVVALRACCGQCLAEEDEVTLVIYYSGNQDINDFLMCGSFFTWTNGPLWNGGVEYFQDIIPSGFKISSVQLVIYGAPSSVACSQDVCDDVTVIATHPKFYFY